jgi:hypothetical protein
MIASTGVPPTGRSSAFANRFSGFHRAKRLIGGSSLTGVSVATGVRRSRTRIDPCFRAARTHAPVRRCSSLIEISFMCHIVTHCWSTGKPWPTLRGTSCRTSRTRRKALGFDARPVRQGPPPRTVSLYRSGTRQSNRSKPKCGAAAGHQPTRELEAQEPWLAAVLSPKGRRQEPQFHRHHRCTMSCTPRTRRSLSDCFSAGTRWACWSFKRQTPDRKAAALPPRIAAEKNCRFHIYLRSA